MIDERLARVARIIDPEAFTGTWRDSTANGNARGLAAFDKARAVLAELAGEIANSERYAVLRQRVELRHHRVMSGATRVGLDIGIGRTFLDSPLPRSNPPDAQERKAEELDKAIDEARGG